MGSIIQKRRGRPRKSGLISFGDFKPEIQETVSAPSSQPEEKQVVDKEALDSRQKISQEITLLRACKSRLVQIPEAIDEARELGLLIAGLELLSGRIGLACQRCHLRGHVFGDGQHECLNGSPYSGESNLSSAGK